MILLAVYVKVQVRRINIMTKNVKTGKKLIKRRVSPGKLRHGGYSYVSSGIMPQDKKYLERYLTQMREAYIIDIGPTEKDLTAGQLLLLNKLVTLEGLTRCMEVHIARKESFELIRNHSTYVNLVLKIVQMLGIERRELEPETTLAEIIAVSDEKEGDKSQ